VKPYRIYNNTHVVVYDAHPDYPNMDIAARVWWTFRVFGLNSVSILDGGLRQWILEGRAIDKSNDTVC
jgi:thiosulfate/3-mercaptopyruvate sulfurtransferase